MYLCINWYEEKVSIKPDADDNNFAIETGAQFTAHFWVDKGQTSKIMHFVKIFISFKIIIAYI